MKKNQVILNCSFCGCDYSVKFSRAKKSTFCSNKCKNFGDSKRMKGAKMPSKCVKDKPGPHTRVEPAKVCGHITKKGRSYCPKCREAYYSFVEDVSCAICNKKMKFSKSQAVKYKCCSMKCRNLLISKRQTGKNSHLWRGGLTDESRKQRNSAKYDHWRTSVLLRDDYTCQECFKRGGRICADHIKEWFLYPALRFDLNNGRTLCVECHRKTDSFGGRSWAKMRLLEENGKLQLMLI